jgi:hypothetical protein
MTTTAPHDNLKFLFKTLVECMRLTSNEDYVFCRPQVCDQVYGFIWINFP